MQHVCSSVARRATPLVRHVSSKLNLQTPPPGGFALPPKKLRALVTLYHQSKSFITPENLDESIDRAFLEVHGTRTFGHRKLDWPSLRLEVKERKRLSKFGLTETLTSTLGMYEAGYEERETRVEQVFDAMYGTWQTNKPGLELLQDTWEDVEQRLKEEEEKP
ncbi:hypothetical protein EDB83DRAFT_2350113 [Lactarius deliciosus]|nr:hypothetical protein EDB83DRAFT_2350113 [Lactarius deliciosus]